MAAEEKYVVLVEDNPDDVTLTEMAFRKSQVKSRMVVLGDGEDALDFLFSRGMYNDRKPADNPALVILDLKLPRVDGLEVLEKIRADKRTASIPVVVLTSSLEDRDLSESRRLGADDYIRKPTSLTTFINIVQQIKCRWLEPSTVSR